ncbi:hydroxysqualene dehydroxylase HpnE [uncultured Piscinibacter sp.]|uniref:hydroxysqualene dehydroxylase HpnE n=1 Tax=uncultured Piscinibacter sp. TaxID=1131835 RepID=UPI002636259E|nr:hydroxysqualene dehydroxylase HpnE [uncultured Piscinibacter sp.]
MPRSLAVIGAGWAGLAAAVEATRAGHAVTLFEMAAQAGGRAREVRHEGIALDNGQHILIGAYVQTLRLMREVGVDIDTALLRTPLRLTEADGRGLHLPAGSPTLAFAAGVWRRAGWTLRDRLALLAAASGWALHGFRCPPSLTVESLTIRLGTTLARDLIEPLCVAALNTPACEASAAVFLRVLRDALFSGPGSADLLLPRVSLGDLFPAPALARLRDRGADTRLSSRVQRLERDGTSWRVDGECFDAVILATPPEEAARLVAQHAEAWSLNASALAYEPIITVYLDAGITRLSEPMIALRSGADEPAQFVFDRGQLGGPIGLLAFVISGARRWVNAGREATLAATLAQARRSLGPQLRGEPVLKLQIIEKRATFRCVPGLVRPTMTIAPGLLAVGDHVDGPYPATIEGAVLSAVQAVAALS